MTGTTPETAAPLREVRFEYTPNFPEILRHLRASLLVTTYQAGKLLVLGADADRLLISFSNYEQAMGLAVDAQRIAIGSRRQIHFLVAAHECAGEVEPKGRHDGCFVPRSTHYTGSIHGHDLAWGEQGLWVINTLFSCLCTLHEGYNFVPRWRPPFVSQLIDQDRCHLNGLAMEQGRPRYVTALAESDEPAGWRPTKATSGCVIDVPSGETIARGFAMPHSPRIHDGRLWLLDSGTGRCGILDPATGHFETVDTLPGYTRGLCFAGQFAFVGLSKIRETAVFGGMPIAAQHERLRCGVAVIDRVTGRSVAAFQFHSGVDEIFAVDALLGMQNPIAAGSTVDENEREVWIVPPPGQPPHVTASIPIYTRSVPQPAATATALHAASSRELAARAIDLQHSGRLDEAAACFQQAIRTADKPAPLWVDLGNLRQEQGDQDAALECYLRAVDQDPDCVPARQNLGYLLFNRGEPERALDHYEYLVKLAPTPLNQLLCASVLPVVYGSAREVTGWRSRLEDALRQLASSGQTIDATRQLVPTAFFLAYQGLNDRPVMELRGEVIRGASDWQLCERHAPKARSPLRIGFLSAYFRDHTIGRLNLGRIEQLDREHFHVTVAYAARNGDDMTERFRQAADQFVTLPRDVAAARQILRDCDLDILFFADVGMDALTSTLAFSRMAPLQCVTWGHPDTTGSPTMDYFVSSQLLETPQGEAHYSERLVRLPLLGVYYERPRRTGPAASRESFGLAAQRHIYLCPQTLFKFHPEFDPILAAILREDPAGELVVIEGRVPEWTRRLKQRWSEALSDAYSRVRFLPAQPRNDFLGLLACADVILDPIHFGGGNTSYEALAMGTPIVTLPGPFLRSRITAALYQKMRCTELIVDSPISYVHTALRLATDPAYRKGVRDRLAATAGVLFTDPEEVRCLERFFLSPQQGEGGRFN